jgi:hypothetical protein
VATITETTGALQVELVMNGNATSLKPAWRYGLAGPSLPEIHRRVSVRLPVLRIARRSMARGCWAITAHG